MDDVAPSLGRKLVFSALAACLFAVLLAALGEAALRWVAPKSDGVKSGVLLEGSARLFGLRPGYRLLQTGVVVQTNSLGFRENDYPVERRPGVRRIVVLGDSFTFGTGVEFQEIYSKRLEAALNRSGERYEVINFGVPGYNTTLELATFREVAARFQPDLVILGYVLNDTDRYGRDTPAPGQHQAGRSVANSMHQALKDASLLYRYLVPRIGALAGRFNARFTTDQILASFDDAAPGWVESRNALLDLVHEAGALGAGTLVVVFPMMADSYPLKAAHAKIIRFGREHGIDMLDLMSVVLEHDVHDMVVKLDGHPNGRAHEIFAQRIHQHLSQSYAPLKRALDDREPSPNGLARFDVLTH